MLWSLTEIRTLHTWGLALKSEPHCGNVVGTPLHGSNIREFINAAKSRRWDIRWVSSLFPWSPVRIKLLVNLLPGSSRITATLTLFRILSHLFWCAHILILWSRNGNTAPRLRGIIILSRLLLRRPRSCARAPRFRGGQFLRYQSQWLR